MASPSDDRFVILVCRDPDKDQLQPETSSHELLLSTEDLQSWGLSTEVHHRTVKIKAGRRRQVLGRCWFSSRI